MTRRRYINKSSNGKKVKRKRLSYKKKYRGGEDCPPESFQHRIWEAYDALNKALDSNHEFKIYFKNYQIFTGTSTLDKTQSMRITISSQSLNYLMATFQAPNRPQ